MRDNIITATASAPACFKAKEFVDGLTTGAALSQLGGAGMDTRFAAARTACRIAGYGDYPLQPSELIRYNLTPEA